MRGPATSSSHYEAARAARAVHAPLDRARRCEVCVIGGGLLGVTAAFHLARGGIDTILIEAARLGAGASGRNGGQVIPGFSTSPRRLIEIAGAAQARAIWHWTRVATDRTRALVAEHAPHAFHGDGVIAAASDETEVAALRDDQAAIAGPLDDDAMEWLDEGTTRARIGSRRYVAALRDPRAFHLDPLALLEALAGAAHAAGARIAEATPALAIAPDGGSWRVTTPSAEITATHVVLAAQRMTGALWPARRGLALPIWTSMLATAPLPAALRARLLPGRDAVYDLATTLAYWRLTPEGRLLFGAGASGRILDTVRAEARLRPFLLRIYPDLEAIAIERVWSGVVDLTLDRLPRFAAPATGLWIGHGLGGHGVALAVGGGHAIADAIAGDRTAFDRIAALPQRAIPLAGLVGRFAVPAALAWLRLVAPRS
ncbi:MAG: FAD-binding oxidoreductase [Alphaproteobacteria bacterium]|nr:FAD-binding oxidoreductase [Alphaproteobacteria bacterium]